MENFVILGASGDLAKRKLFPALWDVFQKGYKCNYIGYGRTIFSNEEFRNIVKDSVNDSDEKFLSQFSYVSGDYNFQGLKEIKKFLINDRTTYYLSLPIRIELVKEVVLGLAKAKLLSGEFRMVIEKPFGTDYETANELMSFLEQSVGKDNLFLIDHYLSKDIVRNLISLRFANPIFENMWSNKHIEKIEIRALEMVGIENRGQYYDVTGAIKDMIQNHLLQILSLVLMNKPNLLNHTSVEREKIKILKNLQIYNNEFDDNVIIDQYKGYLTEDYVEKDSLTETYALLKVEINNERWKGVPIILETGKKQKQKTTQITVYFKGFEECPWNENCPSITKNKLVLNIYPDNDIQLFINSNYSKPEEIKQIPLEFSFSKDVDLSLPYANVLRDIHNNDKTYCPSTKEVLLSWRFVDEVMNWMGDKRERLMISDAVDKK